METKNAVGDFKERQSIKTDIEDALKFLEHQPIMALSLLVNATGRLAEHAKTLGGSIVGFDWPTAQGFRIVKEPKEALQS